MHGLGTTGGATTALTSAKPPKRLMFRGFCVVSINISRKAMEPCPVANVR